MAEGSSNSIINFGDISKPATVLIEKISEAVGGCFKPFQIKRVAKAEAEAELIKAQAQIEISELQKRALTRFVAEEAQKQENIENITKKALPDLSDSAEPEKMENDWITNFFDRCRIVSDDEMQSLWAKVLAGEASTPGTFSKRTVNFLGSLDKADAHLFTNLCSFCFYIGDETPLIYDAKNQIYADKGIKFASLTHLDDIGLINFSHISSFKRIGLNQLGIFHYFGTPVLVQFKNANNNEIETGKVLLTKTGQQLAKICGAKPIEGFLNYVISKWEQEGFEVIGPLHPNKNS